MPGGDPRTDPIAEKNALYDTATSDLWRLAVYEPVHNGREFTNMGGAALLDGIGAELRLGSTSRVLELCSGTGEVCRYLADRFGCHMTGVELNTAQLRHAETTRARSAADTAARIRYVHDDVNIWAPDGTYDAVVAVDSLALLGDPGDALATAYAALRPGGHLIFADILTGRHLSAPVRARAWEYDGIRPLPEPADTAELLAHLGYTGIAYRDLTGTAVDCFRVISGALTLNRKAVSAVCEPGEYRHWCDSTDFYIDAFSSGELTYWRFTARRPDRGEA